MTDYTDIANVSVEPLAPVTSELMTSLRDNPIAISEGSLGAPNMYVGLAKRLQAGALGSWVFATCSDASNSYGSLVAGSKLRPAGAIYGIRFQASVTDITTNLTLGNPLTGTWMCLGYHTKSVTASEGGGGGSRIVEGATLWMRTV